MRKFIFILCIVTINSLVLISQTPIPYSITNLTGFYSSGTNLFEATKISTGTSSTDFIVEATNKMTLKASELIHLQENTFAKQFLNSASSGFFHAYIAPNQVNVASFHPNGFNNIGRFERFELGISLPSNIDTQVEDFLNGQSGTNPYDPDQLLIEANYYTTQILTINPPGFFPPTYTIAIPLSYKREGFYYRDITTTLGNYSQSKSAYPFRIRLAPEVNGTYSVNITVKYFGTVIASANNILFNVIESGKRGNIRVSGNSGHLVDYQGNDFFAIGQNIARTIYPNFYSQPNEFDQQRSYITDLANNSGNFFRIRMDAFSNDIEWEELGIYGSNSTLGLNFKRQWHAYELDKTFKLAEDNGLYMFFTLLNDLEFNASPAFTPNFGEGWANNPYKLYANAAQPEDFFDITNPTFLVPYKKKLRYIMARYGYSANIGILSLINETDNINNYNSADFIKRYNARNRIKSWHNHIGNYLKSNFYPTFMQTSGYATEYKTPDDGVGNNPNFDIVTVNNYSNSRRTIKFREDDNHKNVTNGNSKPFIYGELGAGLCIQAHEDWYSDADFHNTVWATAMNDKAIGCGLYWWDWENTNINHRINFKALNTFFTNSGPSFSALNFKSNWDSDLGITGLLKNRKIEWVASVESSGAKGYGWMHNSDYFWGNDPLKLPETIAVSGTSCYATPNSSADPGEKVAPYGFPQHFETTTLKQYQGLKKFEIDIWNCYGNGGYILTLKDKSSILGRIKFKHKVGTYAGDPLGDPDFAFKVHKENQNFRFNSNYNESEVDTEYVSANNNCIKAFGYLPEAKVGTHKWQVDNGTLINEENPTLCFNQPKAYYINHSFVDTLGKIVTLSQVIQIVDKGTLTNNLGENISNDIYVYPNPTSGIIKIKSKKIITSIKLVNLLGQVIYESNNLNITDIQNDILQSQLNGAYNLFIVFNDFSMINFKIIKM